MNTKFTIKNFRVFDEKGVSIDIKPMTILTGCNSSGKSSIVKATFLLNSFMKQVAKAIDNGEEPQLSKYKLDFTDYPNNLLGRFDKVLPLGSSSHKVTLGYTVHSGLISKDVDVELVFAADANDELNNGYLESLSMSTDEGMFYFSGKENTCFYNLNIIKKYLSPYVKAKEVVDDVCHLWSLPIDDFMGITEEEFEKEKGLLIPKLQGIGKDRVMDIVRFIRFKEKPNSLKYTKEQTELLLWSEENDSFFYLPVLEYLRSISKTDIKSVVESEMMSDDEENTYLAKRSVVLMASRKVLDDFIASSFNTFDEYFKDYEHRFMEHAIALGNNNPCLAKVSIDQEYINNHPDGFYGHSVSLTFDEDGALSEKEEQTPEKKIKDWKEKPLTFDDIYSIVMLWNEKYTTENSGYYTGGCNEMEGFLPGGDSFTLPGSYHHKAFEMLVSFADNLIHEVISITGFENISYVSSSRATVKKLYSMEEKSDFTELLQRYFEAKRIFADHDKRIRPKYKVDDFLCHWLKQFGLGESLSFELDEDGLGVKIRLYKNSSDKGHLLSDEGYGITQLVSILLQIETAILSAKNQKFNNNYGLRALDEYEEGEFHYEEHTIAIEEPEIHLHPSYQSKLAEMFAEAYSKYNIHFIIETHSEYLIRKLQTFVAHKKIDSNDVSICYVYSKDDYISPSDTRVKHLPIKEDGNLGDSFGTGFFDEADNLSVELMSLKIEKS